MKYKCKLPNCDFATDSIDDAWGHYLVHSFEGKHLLYMGKKLKKNEFINRVSNFFVIQPENKSKVETFISHKKTPQDSGSIQKSLRTNCHIAPKSSRQNSTERCCSYYAVPPITPPNSQHTETQLPPEDQARLERIRKHYAKEDNEVKEQPSSLSQPKKLKPRIEEQTTKGKKQKRNGGKNRGTKGRSLQQKKARKKNTDKKERSSESIYWGSVLLSRFESNRSRH